MDGFLRSESSEAEVHGFDQTSMDFLCSPWPSSNGSLNEHRGISSEFGNISPSSSFLTEPTAADLSYNISGRSLPGTDDLFCELGTSNADSKSTGSVGYDDRMMYPHLAGTSLDRFGIHFGTRICNAMGSRRSGLLDMAPQGQTRSEHTISFNDSDELQWHSTQDQGPSTAAMWPFTPAKPSPRYFPGRLTSQSTSGRRFSCSQPWCSTLFARDSDRIRHETSKHGINRNVYFCRIVGCSQRIGTGYKRKDKLTEHMWKKHADRGYAKRV